ncbi:MAG: HypC/HybG/HupF family hydrogenase formation chaperone [Candidatus Omnitrophota bacterium]
MCLAVPMKVTKLEGDRGTVESGGVRRTISIALMKGLSIGDYVIVHAGFAIGKLDEKRARETLQALREIRLR